MANKTAFDQNLSASTVSTLILGFFLNATIAYTIMTCRKLHDMSYMPVLVLLMQDTILLFIMIIKYITVVLAVPGFQYGSTICQIFVYLAMMTMVVRSLIQCIICIDRYYTLIKPLSPWFQENKSQFILTGITLALACALIAAVPSTVLVVYRPYRLYPCDIFYKSQPLQIYMMIIFILFYLLPTSFICFAYVKILLARKYHVKSGPVLPKQYRRERNIKETFMKMMIFIGISYAISTSPQFISLIVHFINFKTFQVAHFNKVMNNTTILIMSSKDILISVVNPCLYYTFDINIRIKLRTILCSQLHWRRGRIAAK